MFRCCCWMECFNNDDDSISSSSKGEKTVSKSNVKQEGELSMNNNQTIIAYNHNNNLLHDNNSTIITTRTTIKKNVHSVEKKKPQMMLLRTIISSLSSISLHQLQQIICILCLCMILLVLNNGIGMVVGKELSRTSYSEQPSAYIIPELNTQFCLACSASESMSFQENIDSSNDTRDTQLLFISVGNEDASNIEVSLQAIPKLGKKIVLVLSSMNVVTFNIKIEQSFPLERVICHSPIQSTVLFTPFYEHQTVKNIPVDYYCVKGSTCSYKILVTTSTVGWYGGGQLFTELMSKHLNLEWRAFMSCGKATKIAAQPIGWPCAALSDELIIYMTLSLFLFSISFISCIVLVLLRWYCIRVRAREEYLLRQAQNMDFGSEEDLKSDSKIVQLKTTTTTTTIITTTNTAPVIQV